MEVWKQSNTHSFLPQGRVEGEMLTASAVHLALCDEFFCRAAGWDVGCSGCGVAAPIVQLPCSAATSPAYISAIQGNSPTAQCPPLPGRSEQLQLCPSLGKCAAAVAHGIHCTANRALLCKHSVEEPSLPARLREKQGVGKFRRRG